MQAISWNPGTLLQTSGSYWQACTLHAATKLDLFSALAEAPRSAKALTDAMRSDERGLTMLLDALVAMGLLTKLGDAFDVTDAVRRFLVKSSPDYLGHIILHHHYLVPSWSKLDEAVEKGGPVRNPDEGHDDQRREAFIMGMYNLASGQAPDIVSQIPLDHHAHFLDLGGGPGTYAIHFCLHNPHLSAVVFDLPSTRPFAEKTIKRHGLSNRITFTAGNYLSDPLAGRYDVVWVSHILHSENMKQCEDIIAKAVAALNPGGLLLVHDFILNNSMDGPLFPALFSLNMLLGTHEGQSYSEAQLKSMMKNAGLDRIERLPYNGPTESGIMKGLKD